MKRLQVTRLKVEAQEWGCGADDRAAARLEQPDQFVHGHFDVPEDGTQQARTERFAGVHRDSGRSAVPVLEKT